MTISISETVASPFAELKSLLEGCEPGKNQIDLSLGEPRHPMPEGIAQILEQHHAEFGRYPPIKGIETLRQAIAGWHERRYPSLHGKITPEAHILPLTGSREGLFSAVFSALDRRRDIANPAVLIPNPFYQCYAAGALAGGAEPIFLDAGPQDGFLPNLDRIDSDLLSRTVALYLCSPSNPQGAVATRDYLRRAIELARNHDFLLFSDECYSEIYRQDPPEGALEVSFAHFGDFMNVVAFNSLSKRSNLPGLRSAFVAGDPEFLEKFLKFRNVASPQMPLPIQHASAAIWSDESHVSLNRELYNQKIAAAEQILGEKFDFQAPQGGFFLWLNMEKLGGGEIATKTLWKGSGVKLLPGAYLAMTGKDGINPGKPYVRVALVDTLERTQEALERLVGY